MKKLELSLVKQSGGIEYTIEKMKGYQNKALEESSIIRGRAKKLNEGETP
ncbi:hypothetical protein N9Y89_01750 [bacterium]|nr:hypothetical protein [bacterium]